MTEEQPPADRASDWAAWAISVLNGAFGDYLRDRGNSLAIDMAFYHQGRPLALTLESLLRAHPRPTPKICVLIHGLSCDVSIWSYGDTPQDPDTSYGALLRADLGYTPFFVRYNTGLPIAENGRALAALLDDLLTIYPARVDEIALIGHSMGGLVLRSACHEGVERRSGWVEQVRQVFYLATPHSGANLEKLGHITTKVLHAVPNPITRLVGDIINLRSRGVKDLRSGNLLHPDETDEPPRHGWKALPWLTGARHYMIVGSLTADLAHPAAALFGDGLVHAPRPHEPWHVDDEEPPIPGENVRLFPGVHHLKLAHDPAVYQQIRAWCASE
ncbi:MAG TPA: hypothetical protein VF897_10125 [Roseiflexaceae bacterium]